MRTIIIAGITRSGLTATMQMLNAGGYPRLGTYPAFEEHAIDNINFEKEAGKAIKTIDTHHHFPPTGEYYVILLKRDHEQQAKSIIKFLRMMGIPAQKRDLLNIKKSIQPDYNKILSWAKRQKAYIEIRFEDIIMKPYLTAAKIENFVGKELNVLAMAEIIIERSPNCYPTMLEAKMI